HFPCVRIRMADFSRMIRPVRRLDRSNILCEVLSMIVARRPDRHLKLDCLLICKTSNMEVYTKHRGSILARRHRLDGVLDLQPRVDSRGRRSKEHEESGSREYTSSHHERAIRESVNSHK